MKRLYGYNVVIFEPPMVKIAVKPKHVKPVSSGCIRHKDCFTCPFEDCVATLKECVIKN